MRAAALAFESPISLALHADRAPSAPQAQLLDSLFGTERGLAATSEVRAEINELITQLEGCNPNPSLDEAAALLDGCWKLVYASNSGVLALLGLGRLPGVTVGDITQTIESGNMTVENQARRLFVFGVSDSALAAGWRTAFTRYFAAGAPPALSWLCAVCSSEQTWERRWELDSVLLQSSDISLSC